MQASEKQRQLINMYKAMAADGYQTVTGEHLENVFSSMEIRFVAGAVKDVFSAFKIETMLDYGCGGSNYDAPGFIDELSAKDFFGLNRVFLFQPARNIDERNLVDAVVCFDVLEHVFIADVANTVRELFSLARRLLIVNVACYPAGALLPNGENAHITVRPPMWWKGLFDAISADFPDVSVLLICSQAWQKVAPFPMWSAAEWLNRPGFVTAIFRDL